MYLSSSFAGVSTDRVNTGDRGAIYLVEPSIGLSAASTRRWRVTGKPRQSASRSCPQTGY
jgi:hypothetical protein